MDVNGGSTDNCYNRGLALLGLGYRVLAIVDADKPPTPEILQGFLAAGGRSITWGVGRALEDELFASLPDTAIDALMAKALEDPGRELVSEHIRLKAEGMLSLDELLAARGQFTPYQAEQRRILGIASRIRRKGWFKSVTSYQYIGKSIIGPHLADSEAGFQQVINGIKDWIHAA
ncbi:hypothetical protein [Pseudomonas putida]|uniref:hypothetical protein n=1 Tax=Pseudomonas putida TaxID=303 RepID=UPI00201322BB|nr:hypothetical protein [Pseudomonas putida]